MSQLDARGAAEEDHTTSEFPADAGAATPAALLERSIALRPTFQGSMQTGSAFFEPSGVRSKSAEVDNPVGRRVGWEYVTQLTLTGLPLMIADLALLAAVIAVARYFLFFLGRIPGMDLSVVFFPIATGFVLISAEMGLYPGIRLSPVDEFRRLSVAVTSLFAVWIVGLVVLSADQYLWDRILFVLIAYALYLVALPMFRSATRGFLARWSWWGFPTLVCGHDPSAAKIHNWLASNGRLGLRTMGVIADHEDLGIEGDEPWHAGTWAQANEIAKRKRVYWAVVVPPEDSLVPVTAAISEHLNTVPHIHVLSELTGLPDHWTRHPQVDGLSGIHLQQNLMLPLPRITKRLMDLIFGTLGALLLLPVMFYIAVAVKMSSRGPIIYGHERIGKDGRRFRAWKFRSMFENAGGVLEQYLEAHPELQEEWKRDHKLKYDPRTTRIGRFIRKTSLDELPQLWNIIRGDMSLVGPRPIVTAEIVKYGPYYNLYTMVPPGITGLWQVSGRNNTTYEERVQLDAYYVRNWSFWMDLYLLVRTIRIVLFAHGAY